MKYRTFLASLMLFFSLSLFAETYSGICGDNLTWTLDTETGVFTVSGSGAMKNYTYNTKPNTPWYSYRTSISTVTIEDGVTSIGQNAFYGCSSLTSIAIPSSVTNIGTTAFYNCSKLIAVHMSDISAWCKIAFGNSSANPLSEAHNLYLNGTLVTDLIIPTSVTSIGNYAFYGYSSLTSVTIPNSVTSIGSNAFSSCSSLTSIEIPNSVTSIGSSAFSSCSSLTSVIIPNSVTSIGNSVFSSCSSLTSVTIPNSVTSIGSNAFYNCSQLTAVHISDIAAWCKIEFNNSDANPLKYAHNLYMNGTLVTDLVIPDGVTSIKSYAFYGCSSLTSVTIPNSVTSIGTYAFYGCKSLTSATIGNSVTSIGKWAFYGCSSLTSITIPNSVTSIGESAFYKCSSLTSVTIPNSVTSIGSDAFYNCSSLTSATIGNGVTSIGQYAFSGCSKLTAVHISDISAWCKIAFSNSSANPLSEAHNLYLNGTLVTDLIIPDGVTNIKNYAFDGCSSLTSVTIPNSVTSLKNYAFRSCSSLTSATIGNGVTSIGSSAFSSCSSLTSVIIPNSVTSIGNSVFSSCSSLTSVIIPNSVTSITYATFNGCSSLTSVIIPNSVTSIGENAFYNCSSLTSIEIPNSVTSIGEKAFYNCSLLTAVHISDIAAWCKIAFGDSDANPLKYAHNLYLNGTLVTDLIIPDGVTNIKNYAFDGCSSLTSVTIPNSVTSIGTYAFYGCKSLTSATIGNSVKSIGQDAFYNCSSLTSIEIPNSVTSIGAYAFSGCSTLTSVTSKSYNPPALGTSVFNKVDKSIPLYVPEETIDLYKAAAQWKDFNNIIPIPSSTTETFVITFVNYDGTELQSGSVEVGTMPEYNGATPAKPDDAQYSYIFTGWKPEITVVTGVAVYTAVYEKTGRLPDAVISGFEADVTEADPNTDITLTVQVSNNGNGVLPAHTQVVIMEDGRSLTSGYTVGAIETQQSEEVQIVITLPDKPGNHSYMAVVNADKAVAEMSYNNNSSKAVSIRVKQPFSANLYADKAVYTVGEEMVLTGDISGEVIANQQVEIYAVNKGYRSSMTAVTDADGHFSITYRPMSGQFGHFSLGACYPGSGKKEEMVGVEVAGLRADYPQVRLAAGEKKNAVIELKNLCQLPLTDVTIEATPPAGVTLQFANVNTVNGNETVQVLFSIRCETVTQGNEWQTVPFTVTSAEGITTSSTIYYYCQPARAELKADIDGINTTMTLTEPVYYSFYLYNTGGGETGDIRLSLPGFIRSLSPNLIHSLAPNEGTPVYLQIVPLSGMQLNNPVTGQIAVLCENANGLAIPFSIEPVSNVSGTLKVDVCDELTYYTEEHPHVEGAHVLVMHPVTGAEMAVGVTDVNGLFETTLKAGYYALAVTAENHQLDTSFIFVEPDKETYKLVNLGTTPVKVWWTMEETEVDDVYEIVSTFEYETRVPVPVVILDMPRRIAADELEDGESLYFDATLTNKGLITAQDVQLLLPQNNPAFTFEALDYTEPFELEAKQSVTIPVRVTRKVRSQNAPARKGNCPPNEPQCKDDDPCVDYPGALWFWDCSPTDRKMHRYSSVVELGQCIRNYFNPLTHPTSVGNSHLPSLPIIFPPFNPTVGGNYPSLPSWFVENNNNVKGPEVVVEDCEPCINTFSHKLVRCTLKHLPIFSQVMDLFDAVGCIKDFINTNVWIFLFENDCWQEYVPIWKWVKEAEEIFNDCIKPLYEECTSENVGILDPSDRRRRIPSEFGDGKDYSNYPSYIQSFLQNSSYAFKAVQAGFDMMYAFFGDSAFAEVPDESLKALCQYVQVWDGESEEIWNYRTEEISEEKFARFVERVRNTKLGIESDNKIDIQAMIDCLKVIDGAKSYANSLGFTSLSAFYQAVVDDLDAHMEGSTSTVCSKIKLQISQDAVITRQAFEGTLTIFNGHETNPMQNVVLNLEITNLETGETATEHEFQINLDELVGFDGEQTLAGGWSLDAQGTGTARIIFIPTKYAAETDSVKYSFGGTISYVAPYGGYTITKRLFPRVLTVAPEPNLQLTYFMQRDILGDDPLTENEEEPMEEAEFALLINNIGNGTAGNMRMVTHQPKIIENEKGLYIDFLLTRSEQNGSQVNMSLDSTIVNEYGKLAPHSTTYVQWYMTSTLLGHFTDYKVEVNHLTGYGNADLSLIERASIHELIRSVHVPSTQTKTIGWVVNDVVDSDDLPDSLYHTDGSITRVTIATTMEAVASTEANTYVLTVNGEAENWVYGSMLDPVRGRKKLIKVVRNEDQAEISLRNFWQTDRTLRDGREPLKENRLHMADSLMSATQSYTLYYDDKPVEISKDITLQENENADYYTLFAEDYHGQRINTATLNRQFTNGKWATLCLPFDVRKGQMMSLGLYGRVFEFRYAEMTENNTLVAYFAVAQSLDAGKGYIVNANAKLAQKTSFVFSNVTVNTDADNGDIATLTGYNDASGRGSIYMVGTLRTGTLYNYAGGNTYLGLKDNKLYYPNLTTGTAVRAYRGFFRSDEPVNAQRVRIVAEGETVTELEIMNGDADMQDVQPARKFIDNGILYIERNGKVYTPQGAEVR